MNIFAENLIQTMTLKFQYLNRTNGKDRISLYLIQRTEGCQNLYLLFLLFPCVSLWPWLLIHLRVHFIEWLTIPIIIINIYYTLIQITYAGLKRRKELPLQANSGDRLERGRLWCDYMRRKGRYFILRVRSINKIYTMFQNELLVRIRLQEVIFNICN